MILAISNEEVQEMPDLERISSGDAVQSLAYMNEEFVERLKDKLSLSEVEAKQLFFDLKQFLFICGTRPGISSPTPVIDQAWHEFILYTEDYADFCQEFFGHYIHHVPRPFCR